MDSPTFDRRTGHGPAADLGISRRYGTPSYALDSQARFYTPAVVGQPGTSALGGAYGCSAHPDDTFDDNADDSYAPNAAHNSPKTDLSCLFSDPARSWRCGGQGFESP
jgi:hypothetical protein